MTALDLEPGRPGDVRPLARGWLVMTRDGWVWCETPVDAARTQTEATEHGDE